MSVYLLPGILGLLTGLLMHWAGFSRQEGLRSAMGLRRSLPLRSGLTATGWAIAVTALLCWLAVIDVDTIRVLPLSVGALLGGTLLGIAAGLCGFTPTMAFAGVGADAALEALSVLAGCALMTLLLPQMEGLLAPLQTPISSATLFRVTLDEAFLLGGGFLGQGCVGLLSAVIAVCVPSPRPAAAQAQPDVPAPEEDAEEAAPAPEDAPEETFVALLPGEEPLVVDTALDEELSAADGAGESGETEDSELPEKIDETDQEEVPEEEAEDPGED